MWCVMKSVDNQYVRRNNVMAKGLYAIFMNQMKNL